MEVTASVSHSVCSAYRHLSSPAQHSRQRRSGRPKPAGGRCYAVLKQHKTRLYILGRCLSMLLCWRDHDSD